MAKKLGRKSVEMLKHDKAQRKNIPTAEFQSVLQKEQQAPRKVTYPRNTDLDPQLVWRGKDEQDWSDLVVPAPPLYIQEKVHPKALIDDLLRETREREHGAGQATADLFADFNGMPKGVDKTEFYQHDQNWSNRMILGDSLQVMASLAEREGLRGKVQCIYLDPPYGIKFNSNFQWSTTDRSPKNEGAGVITREPEQVKAFRDTWRDGIHSYLTYLRDRLSVARDLLSESGSLFVQIGDENVHRVRSVMDEVFGEDNFVSLIPFSKTSGMTPTLLPNVADYLVLYAKHKPNLKYRQLFEVRPAIDNADERYVCVETENHEIVDLSLKQKKGEEPKPKGRILRLLATDSQGTGDARPFSFRGAQCRPPSSRHWSIEYDLLPRVAAAERFHLVGNTLVWKSYRDHGQLRPLANTWTDIRPSGFGESRTYVVQTVTEAVQRCILMTTDPGDLVLDPTCGSGTTATVAEQWGRRWITIDTSRVALALTRARIMGGRYPYYLLADSREGRIREAELNGSTPSSQPVHGDIRQGFIYERVPHVTLGSIASNSEIDVIWTKWQATLKPLCERLNAALSKSWHDWEIPRGLESNWPKSAKDLHASWWEAWLARQKEIDASIARTTVPEYLYDKPYDDKKTVRVAGPFTVESVSPHRVIGVDENDELIDGIKEQRGEYAAKQSFPQMILENLKTAGVQQAHKEGRVAFTALTPWPGSLVCAEGRYLEGDAEKRAAIFIGPEFGTVQRADLVAAAREAGDASFDVLIACAFNYEAHTTEFNRLGRLPVLKARMNADLHMAQDLKNTGKGNLFVIFGEPDIDILTEKDGRLRVKVKGVDVFKPQTGEVVSNGPDEIACWFIDTDYNEESFFVRHAYFLGANDPYTALKTTLKAEVDAEAWTTLKSDTSRPFNKPKNGRIAVKVINHLGDEVMKVFRLN